MTLLPAGVCEPVDTPMCQEKNKLFGQELNCEQKKNCAALNEPGRGEFILACHIQFPNLVVKLFMPNRYFHFASILLIVISQRSLFCCNCVVGSTYQNSY